MNKTIKFKGRSHLLVGRFAWERGTKSFYSKYLNINDNAETYH